MKITMGKKHTLVTNNSKVYSCGKSDDGALGQGPERRNSARLTPIVFPFSAKVIQVSASEYNSAFVMQSGEVAFASFLSLYFKKRCANDHFLKLPIYKFM